MLSIGKLVASSANYYLDVVAKGAEEYYTGAGEAAGVWLGGGAAGLRLSGEVRPEQLHLLLLGVAPDDGRRLALPRADGRRVAGFDLTFSAPKSVSLLYGLARPEFSDAVRIAHDRAVRGAVSYIELHATFARRGANGARRLPTTGLVGAEFRHRTSRAGDPQLHTHVLVANLAEGVDGRWSAPDARLFYFHGRTAGFVYQSILRAELVRSLGVRFRDVRNGVGEVVGVDRRLIQLFSTRRAAIEERLRQLGTATPRAAALATLATRTPKRLAPSDGRCEHPGALRDIWRRRALAHGLDPDSPQRVIRMGRTPLASEDVKSSITSELLGADGLTANSSSFERRHVVRDVAERFSEGADLATIEDLADRVVSSEEVVPLAVAGDGGEERCTTRELLSVERRLLASALRSRNAHVGVVPSPIVEQVITCRPLLSEDQIAMVRRLASSGDGVQLVVGKAGAGKTTALDAARQAFETAGFTVHGVALAARAAAQLKDGSGIDSTTVARFVKAFDEGTVTVGPRAVLIVDEAGMVGTRALGRLVAIVRSHGGKVVLVGDQRQLPEVSAGGAFAALVRRMGAIELHANRRQHAAWERAALDELRAGNVGVGLVAYDARGRLHGYRTAAEARVAMVGAWLASRSPGVTSWMLAPRRSDAAELNALARLALKDAGKLGPDAVTTKDGLGFAVGDEVICLHNDRRIGVLNGTRGEVTGVRDRSLVLSCRGAERVIDPSYIEAGHLDHGYASTVHKSQGATVDRAFVLGTAASYQEAGYVAMSRARSGSDLFVVTGSFESGFEEAVALESVEDRVSPVARGIAEVAEENLDPLEAARRILAVSRAKELALEAAGSTAGPRGDNLSPDMSAAANPLISLLGPEPDDEARLLAWNRAARLVADYRSRAPSSDPLGRRPPGSAEGELYDRAMAAVVEYARFGSPEPGQRDPGLGIER